MLSAFKYPAVVAILVIITISAVSAQQTKINPNGYNVFYYPNGVKSSEGYMRDGKPDGYWITYYPNGKKKSEGNRKNFLLDSTWIFYNELGDTTKKITYYLGKKNGWYITYYTHLDSGFIKNIPKSKVLYVDDKRQGVAYYYYPDGKLKQTIPFKDNYAHGISFEYAPDGRIINVITFRYGRPVETEAINRYDSQGKKQGIWREYYDNGQIKWEATYKNGVLDGYYKEYSPYGTLVKYERYKNGQKIIEKQPENSTSKTLSGNIRLVEEYYPGKKLKHVGTYSDTIPVGLHKYYSPDGKLDSAVWYNDYGIKLGVGQVDSNDRKTGTWKLFYDDGKLMATGEYKNDKRTGKWQFYYKNGQIQQTGYYKNGQPNGKWVWYYPDGKLLRVEYYVNGLHDGDYYELSENGDTIVKAFYTEGELDGPWYLQVGDFMQKGQYEFGRKVGTWKSYYYPEKKLMCIDEYQDGRRNGKHKCYYPNGRLKETGEYLDGKKNGKWYYYTPNGYLFYTVTYQLDEPVRIDGTNVQTE